MVIIQQFKLGNSITWLLIFDNHLIVQLSRNHENMMTKVLHQLLCCSVMIESS